MVKDVVEKAKIILTSKKAAYERTFDINNMDVQIVLEDLAQFCRSNESTFHEDPRAHALLEGRREVWLRIQKHLQLTPDELWEINRRK